MLFLIYRVKQDINKTSITLNSMREKESLLVLLFHRL